MQQPGLRHDEYAVVELLEDAVVRHLAGAGHETAKRADRREVEMYDVVHDLTQHAPEGQTLAGLLFRNGSPVSFQGVLWQCVVSCDCSDRKISTSSRLAVPRPANVTSGPFESHDPNRWIMLPMIPPPIAPRTRIGT